jgi:adenylate cyclase
LFCDIRGFTPISEQYKTNPQGLTELVNRFLTPMTDIIMENEGTIDKYMGDCIFAFWNAPLDVAYQEYCAVKTSVEMYKGLEELNAELESEGLLPINIGIGINTGECVVGNMGSNQRFDYSVLGDSVNLAARLEGQTKGYGVKTLLGEETKAALNEEYFTLELDNIAVKGKEEPVKIYTVVEQATPVEVEMHQEMMKAYYAKQFDVAIKFCEDLKRCFGGEIEKYYDIWQQRCRELDDTLDKGEPWDGVFRATSK